MPSEGLTKQTEYLQKASATQAFTQADWEIIVPRPPQVLLPTASGEPWQRADWSAVLKGTMIGKVILVILLVKVVAVMVIVIVVVVVGVDVTGLVHMEEWT